MADAHGEQNTPRKSRGEKSESGMRGSWCGCLVYPLIAGAMALGALGALRIGSINRLAALPASGSAQSTSSKMGTLERISTGLEEVGTELLAPLKNVFTGPPPPAVPLHPRVVLFGDSLVSQSFDVRPGGRTVIGWGGGLQAWYGGRADISHRGFSDLNTEIALSLLPKVFPRADEKPPQLVIVCFGSNDAALEQVNPNQHVALKHYRRNLLRIIEYIRSLTWETEAQPPGNSGGDGESGSRTTTRQPAILILTPSPVNEHVVENINGELARVCSQISGPDEQVRQCCFLHKGSRCAVGSEVCT